MLSKLLKMKEDREDGFTLIELLVVILIIGILAAIAIPAFMNQRASAIDATVASDVRNVAIASETKALAGSGDYREVTMLSLDPVINVSKGNNWQYDPTVDGLGFCVKVWNDGGGTYSEPSKALTYDSLTGGVGRSGGACS